ncbi:MAG TPA: class I SAM-dependent RNA methyltransferase, partial [Thermomicrobiales bacterium]|nr:class I SAM-dependent RNA methyltransferase [Thermomicrobiales bacterium]
RRRPGRRGPARGPGMTPPPNVEPIEVTVERIVGDGKGIAFHDGQTVFIPETAPGDRIRAKVRSHRGKVIQAEIMEILEPSPQRVEPPCPYFFRCGGCDFQQFSYEDQLATKASMIEDSLRRIAKLDPVPEVPITPSPQPLEYRSRAEWQIDQKERKIGYFASGTHDVIDVEICPILTPNLKTLLTTLREDFANGLVSREAYEYRGVEGDVGLTLEPTGATRSQLVMRTVGGHLYRYNAETFFQANIPVTELLLERVLEIADVAKDEPGIAIDLYCGVGLFTRPLAVRFPRVIGVESDKTTTDFAAENTEAPEDGSNVRIVNAPVERWIAEDRSPLGRVALVVFDPPRAGAGPKVIEDMLRLRPAHIAAVSCDPATFARDIRGLIDGGYELVSIEAFDMFPQTHHVELIGHLHRAELS